MAFENYEIVIVVAIAALILYNVNAILYFLLSILQFFVGSVEGTIHLVLFTLVTVALIVVAVLYCINRNRIRKLSIVDYLPPDEYERKKKEWTDEAMEKLMKNPKFHELKARIESGSMTVPQRVDILSAESDGEND